MVIARPTNAGRRRSDALARRVLAIPDGPPQLSTTQAQRAFSTAMVISGLRCILSYLVFPILLPVIGVASKAEPLYGIPIAVIALIFDVRGIRRVWLAASRRRWEMTGLYVAVMGLVTFLLVHDLVVLAR